MKYKLPNSPTPQLPNSMTPYFAVLSARFRMLLQYRAAAIAGFSTQIAWGWIRVMALEAFYRSTTSSQPMSIEDVVTYVWLGQALLGMLPWGGDADIRALVRSGNVAYEMVRPVDLFNYWYARVLAFRLTPTLLRSVPLIAIALLFFGMSLPPSSEAFGAFLLSLVGALLLSTVITLLISISMLWTISGDGVTQLSPAVVPFFSGMVIPLPLFPDWAQPIMHILPFRGVIDAPFRLYTGHIPAGEVWGVILHQWIWLIALIAIGRWVLARGTQRLVVQGG